MGNYKSKKYLFYRDEPLSVPMIRKINDLTVYQSDKNAVICFDNHNCVQFDCWDSDRDPGITEKFSMFANYLFHSIDLDWNYLFKLARVSNISSRGAERPKLVNVVRLINSEEVCNASDN